MKGLTQTENEFVQTNDTFAHSCYRDIGSIEIIRKKIPEPGLWLRERLLRITPLRRYYISQAWFIEQHAFIFKASRHPRIIGAVNYPVHDTRRVTIVAENESGLRVE